jgi:hypothetical protein
MLDVDNATAEGDVGEFGASAHVVEINATRNADTKIARIMDDLDLNME